MFLLPIAFFAAIALVIWFVFFSEASVLSKILVGVLWAVSFLLRHTKFDLEGFFLQIAVAIFVLLYRKVRT
jgi:hypothetical protein